MLQGKQHNNTSTALPGRTRHLVDIACNDFVKQDTNAYFVHLLNK